MLRFPGRRTHGKLKQNKWTLNSWMDKPSAEREAELLKRKPRVKLRDHHLVLISHPSIPPLELNELSRLGSISSVLRERLGFYKALLSLDKTVSTPELPSSMSTESFKNSVVVIRYQDAIQDFDEAALREKHRNELCS